MEDVVFLARLPLNIQYAERSVREKLAGSDDYNQKTILNFLREATDPDTGEKLQMTDLVVNSAFLLYPSVHNLF